MHFINGYEREIIWLGKVWGVGLGLGLGLRGGVRVRVKGVLTSKRYEALMTVISSVRQT
jgi:hypothetical protein